MTPDKNTLVGRLRAVRSGDPVLIGTIIDDLCDEAADAIERQSRIIEAHQRQIKDGADTIERLKREAECHRFSADKNYLLWAEEQATRLTAYEDAARIVEDAELNSHDPGECRADFVAAIRARHQVVRGMQETKEIVAEIQRMAAMIGMRFVPDPKKIEAFEAGRTTLSNAKGQQE